jgi:hypothetical protein
VSVPSKKEPAVATLGEIHVTTTWIGIVHGIIIDIGIRVNSTSPLAAANMQNEIRVIVSQASGEIRSSQNLPPAVTEGFEKIEIAYDIALPMNRVSQLIYQLETHTPYLFVDRVDLEAPQNASPRSENVVPRIEAHWIIRGYRWKG